MNDKYKISSDRDFVLRLTHTPGIQGKQIKENVYVYLSHDQSLTFADSIANKKFFFELLEISHEGIEENKNDNPLLQNAYKNWMAWAIIRYLFAPAKEGHNSNNVKELIRATKADLLWPLRAIREVYDHIQMGKKENKNLTIVSVSEIAEAI